MKRLLPRLSGHFGITAQRMAVRSQVSWYWRLLGAAALIGIGFGVGYWCFQTGGHIRLPENVQQLQTENQALQTKIVYAERQLQVERAAQASLAKEMAAMQDEDMRLKEDIAFYKSILVEGAGSGILKIHSMKVAKAKNPGEYQYHILLVQSGKHDKPVQGSLQLEISGTQAGKPVVVKLNDGQLSQKARKLNFKYYQKVDGTFSVPGDTTAKTLLARFYEPGAAEPKLVQSVNLPG